MKGGKLLSPKKLERLRRETEKLRRERWKYGVLIAIVAVAGIVVGTAAFIYDRKLHQETYHRHDQQSAGSTNKSGLKSRDTQEQTFK